MGLFFVFFLVRTDVVEHVVDHVLQLVAVALGLALVAVLLDLLLGLHGVETVAVHEGEHVVLILGGGRVGQAVADQDTAEVDLGLAVLVALQDASSESGDVDSCEGLTRDVKVATLELREGSQELGQKDKVIIGGLGIAGVEIGLVIDIGESNAGRSPTIRVGTCEKPYKSG